MGETSMSVYSFRNRSAFWQGLAQALDAYFVNHTKRVVSEAILRRAKHQVALCCRFKQKISPVAAETSATQLRIRRTVKMMTRPTTHPEVDQPPLRGICLIVRGKDPHDRLQPPPATVARLPRRPHPSTLSESIPLFFVGL
jgi:hypothetical protein